MRRAFNRPVWLGLGSNLQQPQQQLRQAVQILAGHPQIKVEALSPLYSSPAMVLPGQVSEAIPDYCNAVLKIATELSAQSLLLLVKDIEKQQGRDFNVPRWSSRVLDIDLLCYQNQQLESDTLTLPHPGIAHRDFVLLPWNDLEPDYWIAGLGTVAECLSALKQKPKASLSAKLIERLWL